jgi:beta-glucosidase-like glycosyl hydrolase
MGSLRRETGFDGLLTSYAQHDETLASYERAVCAAVRSYESQVQMEIDISLGK